MKSILKVIQRLNRKFYEMKTIITYILLLTVAITLTNCSGDDEVLMPAIVKESSQDHELPVQLVPDGAVEIPGFPKSIQKYESGNLKYWTQYYYRADGNLLKVNYGYSNSNSEIYTDTYHYNDEGQLIKLDGHDVYTFYWDKDRIVEADRYNGMWSGRSKIIYEYDAEGRLIKKSENNLDFFEKEITDYTYFDDGNLKMIEQYGDYHESGEFTLYFITEFDYYKRDSNLFLELVIIPGQRAQQYFPSTMKFRHLTETGYDKQETYQYTYDIYGRVIEKLFRSNKVVYQYY